MDLFLKISIIILVGLLGGRIAKKFGLPSVSGYIVAGLLYSSGLGAELEKKAYKKVRR